MIVLDTDHLTKLGYGTPPGRRLAGRIDRSSLEDVITIITVHEQMRGSMARLAGARSVEDQVLAYAGLAERMQLLSKFNHLPFDREAAALFLKLRKQGVRIGTMDLRIACIVMEHDAILLTRNTQDFEKVPGLKFANWLE
jgi:tRNA(fMet)-specific endonuclease VapC